MDQITFPDRATARSDQPAATIDNVKRLLEHSSIVCRYNVIKKKVEIDIPGHRGTLDNRDNVTMTAIINLASQQGMPHSLVPEYVNAIADQQAYNPVCDWIESKAWDGRDRFPALSSTVIAQSEYPEKLKNVLLRKWIRSAAAAAVRPAYKGRGVLTLQGAQGIGKTSWVKALVTDPHLRNSVVKLDHHLDAGNKDSVLSAISNWIVEIGELDSSFKRDVARLKGFLTGDSDRLRRPYDRREAEYARRTVFLATVNDASFLVDRTGNTRWWTIAVEALDYNHSVDMQQLFAQAAVEVSDGASWVLDAGEEVELEAWNARHLTQSVIAEKLDEILDRDRIGASGLPPLTATEVLDAMGLKSPTNPQAKECASALRDLLGEPKRINGKYRWRVPLREPSAADLAPVSAVLAGRSAGATAPGAIF